MIGAEKWDRGYVQGTARDGGEVQGMTGVERGFSLGQGILKSVTVVLVASVYLSVSPLTFHSVYQPLLIYLLIFFIHLDTGLYNLFSIFPFCLFNIFFYFPVSHLVHVLPKTL